MLYAMKETNPKLPDPINIFEDLLGKKLPRDYRLFIEQTNGGVPLKNYYLFNNTDNDGTIINTLFGITSNSRNSLINHYKEYKDIIPAEMIPIGNDQGGNIVLLCISGSDRGSVCFLDHEKPVFLIADSFEEFINNLKSEDEMNLK